MPNPNNMKVAVTAGLRGASWQAERMTTPFSSTPTPLTTQDGQGALGVLFSRGGERKVVFIMHPRELVVTHYLVPDALDAGWACWVQGARSIGNDLRLEHEFARGLQWGQAADKSPKCMIHIKVRVNNRVAG